MTVTITEYVRPYGEAHDIDVDGLMPETEERIREMQEAGFVVSYEALGNGFSAMFIGQEYDVVTRVLSGDSKSMLADIDSAILEWTVDQLRTRHDKIVRENEGIEEGEEE